VHRNVSFGSRTSGGGSATRNTAVTAMATSHIGYKSLDLTGVRRVQVATSTGGNMGALGGIIEIRSGSPEGALLGQATVSVAPAGSGGRAQVAPAPPVQPAPAGQPPPGAAPAGGGTGRGGAGGTVIDLKPTTGRQDLYFVFRNDRATASQPLMTVSAIRILMD
jgi:cytochrome c